MADISQVKLPNGDTYNLVDETSGYITTSIYSGTCASAAADTTKIVACSDFTDLKAGAAILVTFNATNTAAVGDLTLNVNNTGAKKIQYINNGTRGNLSSAGYLKASTTYLFVYDGTYWVAYFNYNTTYSSMTDAEITAGTGTTARTITPARLKTAVETWAPITSVNGQTGNVTLSASDVGAATQTDIDNSVEVFEDYISSIYVKKTYSVNNTTFNITYSDTPALNLTAQNSSQVNGIGISTIGLSIGVTNLSNGVSTGITIQNNNVSIGAPNGSVIIKNVTTPTNNTDAVNKSYVDTVIPKVYSSTNTGGYLTMATLPIYDGTVE